MRFRLFAVLLLVSVVSFPEANAQVSAQDSVYFRTAYANTASVYYKQVGDQSPLYNGSLYTAFPFFIKTGSAYFLSEHYGLGSVVYDGILYDSVYLKYDDLRQLLVYRKDFYDLQLVGERVSFFTVSGHDFIRMVKDTASGLPKSGFYELLYPGRSRVLKLTYKNMQTTTSLEEGILRTVEKKDEYFIRSGNRYLKIKSKSDMLETFQARQDEIKKFMRKNDLNFKRDMENTLIKSAGYYDQMVK